MTEAESAAAVEKYRADLIIWRRRRTPVLAAGLLLSLFYLHKAQQEQTPRHLSPDELLHLDRHISELVELQGLLRVDRSAQVVVSAQQNLYSQIVPLEDDNDHRIAIVLLLGAPGELAHVNPYRVVGRVQVVPPAYAAYARQQGVSVAVRPAAPPSRFFPGLLAVAFALALLLASLPRGAIAASPEWTPRLVAPSEDPATPMLLFLGWCWLVLLGEETFYGYTERHFDSWGPLHFFFCVTGLLVAIGCLRAGPRLVALTPAGFLLERSRERSPLRLPWSEIGWVCASMESDPKRRGATVSQLLLGRDKRTLVQLSQTSAFSTLVQSLQQQMLEDHLEEARAGVMEGREMDFKGIRLSRGAIRLRRFLGWKTIPFHELRPFDSRNEISLGVSNLAVRNPLVLVHLVAELAQLEAPAVVYGEGGRALRLSWRQPDRQRAVI